MRLICCFIFPLVLLIVLISCSNREEHKITKSVPSSIVPLSIFSAPDTNSIPNNEIGSYIRYGLNLINNTSYFIGPDGVAGNNLRNKMNCTNCHLQNGTKAFALNFFNTYKSYPQFRGRENKVLSIEGRVNNCIERPHNGRALSLDSKEMIAIISYIKWVGEKFDAEKHTGHGLKPVDFAGLAADPKRGEAVYIKHCQSCHQASGEGLLNADKSTYTYPPLWGSFSYQESSSMHRVLKAASFIKYNMPNALSSWEKPLLSDQEAIDVAAFINDGSIHPRPKSKYKSYENILNKPIDYFKGPYKDSFPERTHAFGPWDKIISFCESNNLKVIY